MICLTNMESLREVIIECLPKRIVKHGDVSEMMRIEKPQLYASVHPFICNTIYFLAPPTQMPLSSLCYSISLYNADLVFYTQSHMHALCLCFLSILIHPFTLTIKLSNIKILNYFVQQIKY